MFSKIIIQFQLQRIDNRETNKYIFTLLESPMLQIINLTYYYNVEARFE